MTQSELRHQPQLFFDGMAKELRKRMEALGKSPFPVSGICLNCAREKFPEFLTMTPYPSFPGGVQVCLECLPHVEYMALRVSEREK